MEYSREIKVKLAELLGVSILTADSILTRGAWMEHSVYEAGVVADKWLVVFKDGELLHRVNLREDPIC